MSWLQVGALVNQWVSVRKHLAEEEEREAQQEAEAQDPEVGHDTCHLYRMHGTCMHVTDSACLHAPHAKATAMLL